MWKQGQSWKAMFAFLVFMLGSASAGAATLDFSGVPNAVGTITVPGTAGVGAIINHENASSSFIVGSGAAGQSDGFCFSSGHTCEAGGELLFDSAVSNLTFDIDGASPISDSVQISAFNGVSLLSMIIFNSGNQSVGDFAGFSSITRLLFVDNSIAAGVGYSTFTFDGSVSAVPVPAAFWLYGTALIGFVGVSRRRKVA